MPTVADLIEKWLLAQAARPLGPDGCCLAMTDDVMKEHVRLESGLEEAVAVALGFHGPVVYGSKVWAVATYPRTSRVLTHKIQWAKDLPWPPVVPQPPVEKIAGPFPEHKS